MLWSFWHAFLTHLLELILLQTLWCKVHKFTMVTKFCMAAPNNCGYSRQVTLQAPRIFRWLLDIFKLMHCSCKQCSFSTFLNFRYTEVIAITFSNVQTIITCFILLSFPMGQKKKQLMRLITMVAACIHHRLSISRPPDNFS
jgi:hypothetical protein